MSFKNVHLNLKIYGIHFPLCVFVGLCAYIGTHEGQKRVLDALELELCALKHGCWEPNSSLREEHQSLLTTEPILSLAPVSRLNLISIQLYGLMFAYLL